MKFSIVRKPLGSELELQVKLGHSLIVRLVEGASAIDTTFALTLSGLFTKKVYLLSPESEI